MSDPVVETTALPNDATGLLEALKAERRQKADALAKAAAAEQREAARVAELETFRTAAEAWQAHTAAQVKARDEANTAKLAAMPETQRATISALGLDGEKLSQLLSALTPTPDPAQLATPVIPAGGAVPGGAQSAGLAPEIVKWVETSRKDLRGASNAAVEAAYKSYGPGAKAQK